MAFRSFTISTVIYVRPRFARILLAVVLIACTFWENKKDIRKIRGKIADHNFRLIGPPLLKFSVRDVSRPIFPLFRSAEKEWHPDKGESIGGCSPFSPASLFLASSSSEGRGRRHPEKKRKGPPGNHEDEKGIEPKSDTWPLAKWCQQNHHERRNL